MSKRNIAEKNGLKTTGERGMSLVITLLIMAMLFGFVLVAISRTASEAKVSLNDAAEARTLAVSEAGLEDATRDFATILENKLNPSSDDIKDVKDAAVDDFSAKYNITKNLEPLGKSKLIVLQSGSFQGLYSLRDEWQVNVAAQEYSTGVKVETMRRFYNNRIPLFQFGAFYQDDLELNRPPLFTFNGKVHTNSNIFISSFPASSNGGIYFKSKVTAAGEIVNDIWKTGTKLADGTDNTGDVYFPNASGANTKLEVGKGSVTCNNGTGGILKEMGGRGRAYPYPQCVKNTNWSTYDDRFEGNLKSNVSELKLPVDRLGVPLIEIVRRGKNLKDAANVSGATVAVTADTKDNGTVSEERYANKDGIRISLSDSKEKLPGCSGVSTACGIQLDASLGGGALGYQPLSMTDGYKTTAVNGNRLATSGRGVWIKVEKVKWDNDAELPVTEDITEDILSLGMTEAVNSSATPNFRLGNYDSGQDSRSIIKIQRFYIPGAQIPDPSYSYKTTLTNSSISYNIVARRKLANSSSTLSSASICYNFVANNKVTCDDQDNFAEPLVRSGVGVVSSAENSHFKLLCLDTLDNCSKTSSTPTKYLVVPFPIQMYDSREGNRADSNPGFDDEEDDDIYRNGVMSLIDIDVKNLREFLKGTWDGKFPTTTAYAAARGNIGLKSADIPENRGWVMYFSDRRGDYDFDGRYKMEDVNPNSNSNIDEDVDSNGAIDADYTYEAPAQDSTVNAGLAAVTDHAYYRRGVRLINGELLPGKYDSTTPANTKGFTFASENGIYVLGNYNVDYVTLPGGNAPADSTSYYPQDTADHIPASIVGDSVTVLSNSWNDANSFINPFSATSRASSSTQVRFAMIAGDSLTARTTSSTNGNFDGLNGGLHNFMRFLETWKDRRLNYSGSLINLYNSFNNNGRWKCCTTVYDPPIRDWTFDNTFTDPNRLPPGAPFVYYMSFTGFQRVSQ